MCGLVVCGERKRRDAKTGSDGGAVALSAGRGSDRIASRGTRSCSSSSVACTRGSAWNRATKTSSQTTLASATSDMPWWCAKKARTIAGVRAVVRRAASTSRLRGL